MKLLKVIRRETKDQNLSLLFSAIVASGISQMFIIEVMHSVAENITEQVVEYRYFFLFLLCVLLYLFSRRYVLDRSAYLVELSITRIRCRIANKTRRTELATFEKVGASPLYARLTQDALFVSNNAVPMLLNMQAIMVVAFMLIYIAWLSVAIFIIVVLSIFVGTIAYVRYAEIYAYNWKMLSIKETDFFEKFSHILSGFKEIRINRAKSDEVYANYVRVNNEKFLKRMETTELYNVNMLFAQGFFFAGIAAILFVLPNFQAANMETILKVTATLLFIFSPYERLISSISVFAAAENAAENIWELELQLDQKLKHQQKHFNGLSTAQEIPLEFKNAIRLEGLVFEYQNKNVNNNFSVGPINLTIGKSEIIFVTGGNGAGKSTFMKLLTGLYLPKYGRIYLDNPPTEKQRKTYIDTYNYQQYRELFTTIFTDFHLFDKLYGLKDINPIEVKELLREVELPQEKTTYRNGGFTNIKLSSGQKKRLALVNAILEDKDIYIFDEVAADLDPWFRDVYYYKILSNLKAKGKTIFVISHDRKYWEIADRILHLENGQVKEIAQRDFQNYIEHADQAAKSMMVSA